MTLWVRFRHAGAEGFGTLDGNHVQPHAGDLFGSPSPTGLAVPAAEVTTLAPVRPQKFIGLWNNFHALAAKQGNPIPTEPLYFLKSPGSIIGPDAAIVPPAGHAGRVVYEGELGLVIGRTCTNATEVDAEAAIFGLTCVNDVTALDLFGTDPGFAQWARAKGCDTFGPVGPAIATGLDWSALHVRVSLNGRERQSYPTSDMILPPARIVALISREMTLHPGDLIACGTSVGVLPMRPGTVVEVSIDGIGTLRNTYAPEAQPP
jgi:2-keto-4-pentenoate hydratase/2-oxohepta-3-ene-1,7-dioic acid hydratase in catechol pathway